MVGSIFLGVWLRRILPQHHLNQDAQDVVRIGVALIATMAALVLSLLLAAAKSSHDTQSNQIKQTTADFILLDYLLAEYGPDSLPIRKSLRSAIGSYIDGIWREEDTTDRRPFKASVAAERVGLDIRSLSPQNELQRSLKTRALEVTADLEQTRLLLFVEVGYPIPMPFLAVLTIWLMIIFASYSLFTKLNATTFTFLSLFALSAAVAIFLILDLSDAFKGLMMIPSAPLRAALTSLGT